MTIELMAEEKYPLKASDNETYKNIAHVRILSMREAFIEGAKSQQGEIERLLDFLKLHQEWEAMVINDNSLWWPYVEQDALRGDIYEKFLEIQAKRNDLYSLSLNSKK